jgi:hypothetical protein
MDFFNFGRRTRHMQFFEMYQAFPASFFNKEEVEKGNMSKY